MVIKGCRDSRRSAMKNSVISLYQLSHLVSLNPTMQAQIDLNLNSEKQMKMKT